MNTNRMSTNRPANQQQQLQPLTLKIGTYVVTQNLHANPEHNNRIGIIDSYIIPRNRYAIRVQGLDKLANLKPENVRVATEYELNTLLPPTPDTRSSSLNKTTTTVPTSTPTPQQPTTTTRIPLTTTSHPTKSTTSTEKQENQQFTFNEADNNTSNTVYSPAALTAAFIPALFGLWLALVVFSLDALPQITFQDTVHYIKNALTFNSSLNPFEVSIFNLMGVLPLVAISFFWSETTTQTQKLGLLASFFFGCFVLIPVVISIFSQPWVPTSDPVGWSRPVERSPIFTGSLTVLAMGLLAYAIMYGSANAQLYQMNTNPFVRVMTADFVCFVLSSGFWIAHDTSSNPALGWLGLIPVVGPSSYLYMKSSIGRRRRAESLQHESGSTSTSNNDGKKIQ
jgi:hypothetical protein